MTSSSNTRSHSPVSDITWPSLESALSPPAPCPPAPDTSDISWQSLDTVVSPVGIAPLSSTTRSSGQSPQDMVNFPAPPRSPLLDQALAHRGHKSPSSRSSEPHRKHPLEHEDPATPPKKPHQSQPGALGSPFSLRQKRPPISSSQSSCVGEPTTPLRMEVDSLPARGSLSNTPSSRKARPPPGSPVWNQLAALRLSRQSTPVGTSPMASHQSVSSTSSSRKARPPPGSPVWNQLAALRLSRQNTPVGASPVQPQQPSELPARNHSHPPGSNSPPYVPPSPANTMFMNAPNRQNTLIGEGPSPTQWPGPPPVRDVSLLPRENVLSCAAPISRQEDQRMSDGDVSLGNGGGRFISSSLPPNVKAHLAQLQAYYQSVPSLSTLVKATSLKRLVRKPGHPLFQQVFLASLMHALYRPQDPEQRLLILMDPPERTQVLEPQLDFKVNPPTHLIGLCEIPDEDLSLLTWGTCEVSGSNCKIRLTMYDSKGQLHNRDLLLPYAEPLHELFQRSLPSTYNSNTTLRCIEPTWTPQLLSLSKRELGLYFCQLISKVVHELPCEKHILKSGPVVYPRWPVETVEEKVSELCGQLLEEKLRLNNILYGGGLVPECIYLYGKRCELEDTETEDWINAPNYNAQMEDEEYDEEDDQDDQENDEGETNGTTSELAGKAGIQNLGTSNWYVKVTEAISYQNATPTDWSASHTPTPRSLSPAITDELVSRRRELVEEVQDDLLDRPCSRPVNRLAYWNQLQESRFSIELVAFISLHLWLTSLFAQPNHSTLYLEHALVEKLVAAYESDPQSMEPADFSELLNRQILWPVMDRRMHVLALTRVSEVLGYGVNNWVLIDMTVDHCRLTEVDVLLPPHEAFNSKIFSDISTAIIGALSCIFPERDLIEHPSTVPQTLHSFVLPQPHTNDAVALVMLAHLCGKLLNQPVEYVDLGVFRQSLCYYYSYSLRRPEIDYSYPWVGLTDPDGNLLTTTSTEKVRKRRLSLVANRETSPFEVFPRTRSFMTNISSPGPSEPFFTELAQPQSSHAEGFLVGTSGRSERAFEAGTFMGPYPSFRSKFPDRKLHTAEALSLDEFVDLIHSVGGPEHPDAHRLLLTMTHKGKRITIDWLRDVLYPDREWLLVSWDVDSLTATFFDIPKLLEAGSFLPYPNRQASLRYRNELRVRYQGKVIDMHSCPNICFMTFGGNSQFRLIVFFPGKRKKEGRMWRNIPTDEEYEDWYHLFLEALHIVAKRAPERWQHALEKTIEALPTCYDMGKKLSSSSGQARTFPSHRIEPEILNQVFPLMRALVNTTTKYTKYRDYFFHLCGINLKLATQHIHGREDANPLNYAFRIHRFIQWTALNPGDIVADVGLAVNMHRPSAPEDFKRSTLLIRHDPLCEFLRPAYRLPQWDSYIHSHVIAGLRAAALVATLLGGIIKFQAYIKDMVLTYKDREHSVGANYTVDEALGLAHRDKFDSQISAFQENVGKSGSYGVRFEFRTNAWAANRLMQSNPREIIDRMIERDVIACHATETIVAYKLTICQTWQAIVRRQAELALSTRRSPEVMLLACALCYFLKGLVKRPDEMSPSREMTDRLNLVVGAERHGLPYFRADRLEDDCLQVAHSVDAQSFKILWHTGVIIPGGLWIKSSRSARTPAPPPHLPSPPATPHAPPMDETLWTASSENFVNDLIKKRLPRVMWSYFPERFKASGGMADQLRKEPLRRKHWSKIVQPMNILQEVEGDYMRTFERLFPPNFTVIAGTRDFKKYDRDFLRRIRDHIETKPTSHRPAYSKELRRKIQMAVLARYDYLPASQAHLMWAFKPGPKGQRLYRIYTLSS